MVFLNIVIHINSKRLVNVAREVFASFEKLCIFGTDDRSSIWAGAERNSIFACLFSCEAWPALSVFAVMFTKGTRSWLLIFGTKREVFYANLGTCNVFSYMCGAFVTIQIN